MKKIILTMMMVFALLIVIPTSQNISGFDFPLNLVMDDEETIVLGSTYQLNAGAEDTARVRWMSDNPAIATVDDNGVVSGKSIGTTTIRAAYGGMMVECKITVKLADITGAKVARSSNTALKVSWTKVPSASGYVVYRSTKADSGFKSVKTITKGSTVSFTNSKLKNGTTYYYKVRAYKTVSGKKVYGEYTDVMAGAPLKTPAITTKRADFDTIKVSWKKITGASGYEIARSETKSGTYAAIDTVTGNTTVSYDDTTVTFNKTYYYKVRAYKEILGVKFYGAYSGIKSTKTSLDVPVITTTPTTTDITVSWTVVNGADEYEVYRSTSEKGTYSRVDTVTGTSYTDNTADVKKAYYYKVRAAKTEGGVKVYSGYSSIKSAIILDITTITSVTRASDTSLKLTWDKLDGVTGYVVYRSTSETGTYKAVKTITKAATLTYTDTKLTSGTTYYYKVRGYKTVSKKNVEGGYSASDFSVALKTPPLMEGGVSLDAVYFYWNPVNGAIRYELYKSDAKDGIYTLINGGSSTDTYYEDYDVVRDGTYYYKLRAVIEVGGKTIYSDYSTIKTISIVLTPPVFLIDYSGNSVYFYWSSDWQNNVQYEIWRATSEKGTYKKIATSSSDQYGDDTVTKGKTYYYKGRSVLVEGGKTHYSDYSKPVAITILTRPSVKVERVDNSLKISWKKVAGASGYDIYRRNDEFAFIGQFVKTITNSSALNYTDTDLTESTWYYYEVRPYKTISGKKVYSISTIKAGIVLIESASPTLSSPNYYTANIETAYVPGANMIEIWRSGSVDGEFVKRYNWGDGVTNGEDWSLTFNKTYYYKVRGCYTPVGHVGEYDIYDTFCGPFSAVSSVKTQQFKPTLVLSTPETGLGLNYTSGDVISECEIWRSDSETGEYDLIAIGTDPYKYTDTTVLSGNTYYYKVRVRYLNGTETIYSDYSDVKSYSY